MIPFCNVILILFSLPPIWLLSCCNKTNQPTNQTNLFMDEKVDGQLCEHQKFRNAHTHTITLHLNIHSFHREYHSSLKSLFFLWNLFRRLSDWMTVFFFLLIIIFFSYHKNLVTHQKKFSEKSFIPTNQPNRTTFMNNDDDDSLKFYMIRKEFVVVVVDLVYYYYP